jgi:Flp pilus assembly pilin Flp
MRFSARFWRLWHNEQGVNVVEYVAVSTVALIAVGIILASLTAGRMEIGRTMAEYHAALIASFDTGLEGTANIDAEMHPQPQPVDWRNTSYISAPMLGIPRGLVSLLP